MNAQKKLDSKRKQRQEKQKERKESNRKWVRDTFLAKHYDCSRQSIWRWSAEGKIPKPTKFSEGCSRWDMDLIEALDAEKASA